MNGLIPGMKTNSQATYENIIFFTIVLMVIIKPLRNSGYTVLLITLIQAVYRHVF